MNSPMVTALIAAATLLLPAAAQAKYKKGKPVVCIGSDAITVKGRLIKAETGVDLKGSCMVTLIDSRIEAVNGVKIMGSGTVILKNTVVVASKNAVLSMGSGRAHCVNGSMSGKSAAVRIMGSGNVILNNCKLKGRVVRLGTGKIVKRGGGPAAHEAEEPKADSPGGKVPPGYKRSGPVRCTASQDINLRKRYIHTKGTAVTVVGSCTVNLTDCHIVGGDQAIHVKGSGDVNMRRTFVKGSPTAILISGSGDVRAKDSTIKGRVRVTGNGDFRNQGGNKLTKK